MMLTENAFAVLGAMPGDDRRTLNQKADEAALFGGDDTEAALNQLMQMNRRITAELSWFPNTPQDAARQFMDYARAVQQGQPARIPPTEKLGTPLAQANALAALFEIWPVDQPELFVGLCQAMDGILGRITAEETFEAINADRVMGGWETVPEVGALLEPLNARLRELCAPVSRAIENMNNDAAASTVKALFKQGGIDAQGSVAQAAGDAYSLRIHEKTDDLKAKILSMVEQMNSAAHVSQRDLGVLKERTLAWCSLTAPLRAVPGATRNEARAIGQGFRNALVSFVNKSEAVDKKKNVYVPIFNGTRTFTISYKSKTDSIKKALELTDWLKVNFPEQLDLLNQLREDEKSLKKIIQDEELMLSRAENQALSRGNLGI